MKVDPSVLQKAEAILSKYTLCNSCLGRQFAPRKDEQIELAEQIRKRLGMEEPERCSLCGGIINEIDSTAEDAIHALREYEFKTFLIGASIPHSIIEKEDSLRAEFKLKGGYSVKVEITSALAKRIGATLKRRYDARNPDVVIVVDPMGKFQTITPRSLFVTARYSKAKRGIPQKRARCYDCNGRGCPTCSWTGFADEPSVESELANYLIRIFGAKKAKFSWIGSEDDKSLVLGTGRPFHAEIIEPKKRSAAAARFCTKLKHGIALEGGSVLKERPLPDISFELLTEVNIEVAKPVKKADLLKIEKTFKNVDANQYSPNKMKFLTKRIFALKAEQVSSKRFKATIECEGGTNIKKLVQGNHLEFSPSISEVLGYECKVDAKKPFDTLNVKIVEKIVREPRLIRAETIAEG
ncbi:MAG: hypothetical protein FJ358_06330 [Thaumarchaeota archaeon]|nr:hypothetical protein [Nitrososphaerota archaeon]